MTLMPLKMKIAELFRACETLDPHAVLELVRDQYPGEKYCNLSVVEGHLQSLKAVGIINEENSFLNAEGELICVYRISEYGRSRLAAYE